MLGIASNFEIVRHRCILVGMRSMYFLVSIGSWSSKVRSVVH